MPRGLRIATLLAALLASACAGATIGGSPRDRYLRQLRTAGLEAVALGQDWIRAGDESLHQAAPVDLPFRETGYLPAERPSAVAYALSLQRGRRLVVDVSFASAEGGRLFVDLFEGGASDAEMRRVASLETGAAALTYEVERDGMYLLRVQPELLRGGRYTIVERTLSSLAFPLRGVDVRAVQSGFGAPRGDTREHEGVDIFAPRGTAVLAVTDGIATPDTNALGGNVVWLGSRWQGPRFYYAHLDRWEHAAATRVRAGDVIGYVGNTGNARTTAPHLHFGVYARGAIDPLPFIEPDDPVPAELEPAEDLFGSWVRVTTARTPLRPGPHRAGAPLRQLERDSVARVLAMASGYLRVKLPDDAAGFVGTDAVSSAGRPLRSRGVPVGTHVYEAPSSTAPIVRTLEERTSVDVLGRFGGFDLVRLAPVSSFGWIARAGAQARDARRDRWRPAGDGQPILNRWVRLRR